MIKLKRILATILIPIITCCNVAIAGPLNTTLDSDSRRGIQEAKMLKFGSQSGEKQPLPSLAPQNNSQNKAVQITNLRPSNTLNKSGSQCTVKVGNVVQNNTMRGTRQQNVTLVEGNVINVCQ